MYFTSSWLQRVSDRVRRGLPAVALAAGLLAPSVSHAADAQAPASTYVNQVLELTNAERQKAGLAPLALSAPLAQSAATYAGVLASSACFAHTCGPVPDMVARNEQAGYTDWATMGENIAAGYPSPEAVVTGWMSSPGHRANILNGKFTEIGIGVATGGGAYGTYWAQEFGTRRAGAAAPTFQAQQRAAPADDVDWGDADE